MATMTQEDLTSARLADLEKKVDHGFKHVDERFKQVDDRFKQVDARFDSVDARFDKVDAHLETLEDRFFEMNRSLLVGMFAIVAALLGIIATQV